jgi:hypothetical protein
MVNNTISSSVYFIETQVNLYEQCLLLERLYNWMKDFLEVNRTRSWKIHNFDFWEAEWIPVTYVDVLCVAIPCNVVVGYQRFGERRCFHLQGEDTGSKVLRNVGILPQHYTGSQPTEDIDSNLDRRENVKFRILYFTYDPILSTNWFNNGVSWLLENWLVLFASKNCVRKWH